jgi:SAM-dependent methyltransferase
LPPRKFVEEILNNLRPGERVLDLGSQRGSFPTSACGDGVVVVRVDIDRPEYRPEDNSFFVQADAASLPFRNCSFNALISNHSLEHMTELDRVLSEIGRLLAPGSALFVAVPDASTLSDRVYRFIGKGGGHVNPFVSAEGIASLIRERTGLHLRATRLLHTGWSILRRRPGQNARRLWLFGGGHPAIVRGVSRYARLLDLRFGTRLSVYGWALWFGEIRQQIDITPRILVCSNCGAGLTEEQYRCPYCAEPL